MIRNKKVRFEHFQKKAGEKFGSIVFYKFYIVILRPTWQFVRTSEKLINHGPSI